MPLLGHIIGGATFGLMARFWQLGILKKPMMSTPSGHVACMAFFGAGGYWWWKATVYMQSVLADKEAEMRARRAMLQAVSDERLRTSMDPDRAERLKLVFGNQGDFKLEATPEELAKLKKEA